jgi:hypothetical protein
MVIFEKIRKNYKIWTNNVKEILVTTFDCRLKGEMRTVLLTQNPHPAASTQQAEQASFTHEQIPKRASQFSLKINKRQSS